MILFLPDILFHVVTFSKVPDFPEEITSAPEDSCHPNLSPLTRTIRPDFTPSFTTKSTPPPSPPPSPPPLACNQNDFRPECQSRIIFSRFTNTNIPGTYEKSDELCRCDSENCYELGIQAPLGYEGLTNPSDVESVRNVYSGAWQVSIKFNASTVSEAIICAVNNEQETQNGFTRTIVKSPQWSNQVSGGTLTIFKSDHTKHLPPYLMNVGDSVFFNGQQYAAGGQYLAIIKLIGNITAEAITGPAKQPLPASSQPASVSSLS